jgi:hypothetical protein
MDILKNINEYNKKKMNEIKNILDINTEFTIDFGKEILILNDDNNKKIITSKYIFLGIYQPKTKYWIWASSIPGVSKQNIDLIEKIRNKSYLFEKSDDQITLFIYQLLTQDIIEIQDIDFLPIINNVLNFLSDGIYILNPLNKYKNVQFLCLTKIIEKYV